MIPVAGSITAPKGFAATGVACGLKKDNRLDLALVVSEVPAVATGVFTRNVVKGHSLQRTMDMVKSGLASAVIINSGNANACVGEAGYRDAETMADLTAAELGCPVEQVLTGSTGVIGKRLDLSAIHRGVQEACANLASSEEAGHLAEQAIMTTDLVPKECVVTFELEGKTITVAGMAKGSGMIHPNMATMIGVLTTDCAVEHDVLSALLKSSVNQTFNRVSVDGDTSVCDMVIALANGKAGNTAIRSVDSAAAQQLQKAITIISTQLARLIAQDGEGATKLVEIQCQGARTADDAYKIVQAVGKSPLVKTAIFGEDANWGRILTAAGYSGAEFDPEKCDIYLGDLKVCENGTALLFDEAAAKVILQQKEVLIRILLREGTAFDRLWTCDFSYDYVRINGSYRT
ncbi:MAG: bifunctional glutamate N-acetyltransferase/amino-acid acetyltransferase ArgJ [Eubacteriales bacterium]|nr:bifunctional glutamate N-acetyltransferase/amino-acid acetyltransferase ArgJ [Eubacteriales bacterium]